MTNNKVFVFLVKNAKKKKKEKDSLQLLFGLDITIT